MAQRKSTATRKKDNAKSSSARKTTARTAGNKKSETQSRGKVSY